MDFVRSNWSMLVYILGIVGVYIADHYKIKNIESRLGYFDVQYDSLNKQITVVNNNIIRLQTIIEERFK